MSKAAGPERASRKRRTAEPVSTAPFPPILSVADITERLRSIFPSGIPGREFITRLNTARTVCAALYIGAVEGSDRWLAPRHIYRMREAILEDQEDASRSAYYRKVPPSGEGRWYADNSREGARDEGVRRGLLPLNAMIQRTGVDTTSSKGRYALAAAFADLLNPHLTGEALESRAAEWGRRYLSPAALARAALVQDQDEEGVEVLHPNGGATVLPPGESPRMTKAVVEEFSRRFLAKPAVVWISDSREKAFKDDRLERVLQIKLDAAKILPDVVLVDLDPPGRDGSLLIVFVEVVFSDGPVDEGRRRDLIDLLKASPRGYGEEDATFVTVYADRGSRPAGKSMRELAWSTFAWFVSEPDHLVQFHPEPPRKLGSLI